MFHTPSIRNVEKQAKLMDKPIIIQKTRGKKEKELKDLEKAIKRAIKNYRINGILTGAIESVYQSTRIQKICNKLKVECFNPLWQKDQLELLGNLITNRFTVIVTGVFAYPLNRDYLGKEINKDFIKKISGLNRKYKINPAGEGGEYETLVIDCPLFKKPLQIKEKRIYGSENSWRMEIR